MQRLGVRVAVSRPRGAAAACADAARAAGPIARPVLRTALEILLALIIVFEEWGWRPLADLLGRLARWRPWAAVESLIIRLPPYAALVVFALPTLLLLPLKLLALLLIAKGQVILAGLLFVAAKVVATALIARLFMLTQPALMQIGWFAWTLRHGDAVEGRADGAGARLLGLAVGPRREGARQARRAAEARPLAADADRAEAEVGRRGRKGSCPRPAAGGPDQGTLVGPSIEPVAALSRWRNLRTARRCGCSRRRASGRSPC